MRKIFVFAVAMSLTSMIPRPAQSAATCPSDSHVLYEFIGPFCVASLKDGLCPSGSNVFTLDGRLLCLHRQRPTGKAAEEKAAEEKVPGSRTVSEPHPIAD